MTTLAHAIGLSAQNSASQLREEYVGWSAVFTAQPASVRQYIEAQAKGVAAALLERRTAVPFTLPERVVASDGAARQEALTPVPPASRAQRAGLGLVDRLTGARLDTRLHDRLVALEQSPDQALAVSAGLIRYATAAHMVRDLVPDGQPVVYLAAEGDEIPSFPADPAAGARGFYLPQYVAFDPKGCLIVESDAVAEDHVKAVERCLEILHEAVGLAPYILADKVYEQKRYGLLGQLVNQSRALAYHKLGQLIHIVRERAAAEDLGRGLSLSVPYFDDQALLLRMYDFQVIPPGRVPFIPAFVVRAARAEQAKVAQDARLSTASRTQLLAELKQLERAFDRAHGSKC